MALGGQLGRRHAAVGRADRSRLLVAVVRGRDLARGRVVDLLPPGRRPRLHRDRAARHELVQQGGRRQLERRGQRGVRRRRRRLASLPLRDRRAGGQRRGDPALRRAGRRPAADPAPPLPRPRRSAPGDGAGRLRRVARGRRRRHDDRRDRPGQHQLEHRQPGRPRDDRRGRVQCPVDRTVPRRRRRDVHVPLPDRRRPAAVDRRHQGDRQLGRHGGQRGDRRAEPRARLARPGHRAVRVGRRRGGDAHRRERARAGRSGAAGRRGCGRSRAGPSGSARASITPTSRSEIWRPCSRRWR